jgi:hypothetical protein
LDKEMGRFFSELKRLGLYDRSWIVLTSDHGENFGDCDYFGHGTLCTPNTQIPLVVKAPYQERGRVVKLRASLLDVGATILDITGDIEPGGKHGQGRSFLACLQNPDSCPASSGLQQTVRVLPSLSEHEPKRLFVSTQFADGRSGWLLQFHYTFIEGKGLVASKPTLDKYIDVRTAQGSWRRDLSRATFSGAPAEVLAALEEIHTGRYLEGIPSSPIPEPLSRWASW